MLLLFVTLSLMWVSNYLPIDQILNVSSTTFQFLCWVVGIVVSALLTYYNYSKLKRAYGHAGKLLFARKPKGIEVHYPGELQ